MNISNKPRVGAVSYLNTKPLVHKLRQFAPGIELVFDLPSRLADRLACRELDVALIPSVEAFQDPAYGIISDACIACRGPVLSVKLFSRVPFEKIRSLTLDEGSRTSVALTRILLQERFGLTPRCELLPIGGSVLETTTDAVLLIGDRAIHPPRGPFVGSWDLGDEWTRWCQLPFVFAMWIGRKDRDWSELDLALRQARDAGVRDLDSIAAAEATLVGLSPKECLVYLRDNLHFQLGNSERNGLELFRRRAQNLGLAPSCSMPLEFVSSPTLTAVV
ncbi:MAG: menaquinone biosynthesis protein [Planctomycetes bacterium]|nr:menaquinone biosynthesis protein [Planctomycetota bacterium]